MNDLRTKAVELAVHHYAELPGSLEEIAEEIYRLLIKDESAKKVSDTDETPKSKATPDAELNPLFTKIEAQIGIRVKDPVRRAFALGAVERLRRVMLDG